MKISENTRKRLSQCLQLEREHDDKSLHNAIHKLLDWELNAIERGEDMEVRISNDFCENCFLFSEVYKDEPSRGISGGIIFHGYPDEGYKVNGSIQIDPAYGWHTHT